MTSSGDQQAPLVARDPTVLLRVMRSLSALSAPVEMPVAPGAVSGAGRQATSTLGPACDVAVQDLQLLFTAVCDRLRLVGAATALSEVLDPEHRHDRAATAGLRETVRDCITALDQLQTTVTHEFIRRQQLELEVLRTRAALAKARGELTSTQAGERRARHLSLHDGLTQLPNRDHFHERLARALVPADRRRMPLAVLYIDLDGFKLVNDVFGHSAGDELLCIVAARLARSVRAGDLVSRLGGDEFACLLVDTLDRTQLSQVACKLFDAVSTPFMIGKDRLVVRPSIGIALCPDDGASTDALIRNADKAMVRAKREQVGYAFFDREIDAT